MDDGILLVESWLISATEYIAIDNTPLLPRIQVEWPDRINRLVTPSSRANNHCFVNYLQEQTCFMWLGSIKWFLVYCLTIYLNHVSLAWLSGGNPQQNVPLFDLVADGDMVDELSCSKHVKTNDKNQLWWDLEKHSHRDFKMTIFGWWIYEIWNSNTVKSDFKQLVKVFHFQFHWGCNLDKVVTFCRSKGKCWFGWWDKICEKDQEWAVIWIHKSKAFKLLPVKVTPHYSINFSIDQREWSDAGAWKTSVRKKYVKMLLQSDG